jgi:hypothetical protein
MLVLLLALAAITWWICLSPVRIAAAAGTTGAVTTHAAPPTALAVIVAVLLALIAALIVLRSWQETGGRLMVRGGR